MNVAAIKKYLLERGVTVKWLPQACFGRNRVCCRENDVASRPKFRA